MSFTPEIQGPAQLWCSPHRAWTTAPPRATDPTGLSLILTSSRVPRSATLKRTVALQEGLWGRQPHRMPVSPIRKWALEQHTYVPAGGTTVSGPQVNGVAWTQDLTQLDAPALHLALCVSSGQGHLVDSGEGLQETLQHREVGGNGGSQGEDGVPCCPFSLRELPNWPSASAERIKPVANSPTLCLKEMPPGPALAS